MEILPTNTTDSRKSLPNQGALPMKFRSIQFFELYTTLILLVVSHKIAINNL